AGGQIAVAGQQQGIRQRQLFPPPAGHEAQHGLSRLWQQRAASSRQERLQLAQVALPEQGEGGAGAGQFGLPGVELGIPDPALEQAVALFQRPRMATPQWQELRIHVEDRKSTRLNSSHVKISYAVLFLTKKI